MVNGHPQRKQAILVLLCAVEFMIAVDFSIVNVALPSIKTALGFSTNELQWNITAYALIFGGFLIFGGRIGDIFGHRRMLIGGLGLLVASSLVAGLSQDALMLILLRGAQGMSAALIAPAALALLLTTFTEPAERQRALGAWGSVLGAGFVSGVVAGGLLTQYAGWRWVLLINVPTAALALGFCPALLPAGRDSAGNRNLDIIGGVTITGAVLAIVYAVSTGNSAGWLSAQTLGVAAGAVVLIVAFIFAEKSSPAPLVPLSVFRMRQVSVANAVNLLLIGSFAGVIYVLTLFLHNVHGYTPLQTGLCFALPGVAGFMAGKVAGNLVGKLGIRILLVANLLLQAAAAFALSSLPSSGTAVIVIVCMVVFNFADVAAIVMVNIAATTGIPDDSQGLAGGLLNASQQVGSAIGLAVISVITVTAGDSSGSGHAVSLAGYRWGLITAAIIALAGALLGFAGLRPASAAAEPEPESAPAPEAATAGAGGRDTPTDGMEYQDDGARLPGARSEL
jgi:EmrB/QacA subfamily drug resistance transporter